MITGVHTMFYTSDAQATREFIRDKLMLPCHDVGGGWLIFDLPAADMGCHPTDGHPPSGTHYVSFQCDDIQKTVADLRGRAVTFDDAIRDVGYGLAIHLTMPGNVRVELYQKKYGPGC